MNRISLSSSNICPLPLFYRCPGILTLREWVLVRLRGSREKRTPPPLLRLTRNAFWVPIQRKRENQLLFCPPVSLFPPSRGVLLDTLYRLRSPLLSSRPLLPPKSLNQTEQTYGQPPRSGPQTPGTSGKGSEQTWWWMWAWWMGEGVLLSFFSSSSRLSIKQTRIFKIPPAKCALAVIGPRLVIDLAVLGLVYRYLCYLIIQAFIYIKALRT